MGERVAFTFSANKTRPKDTEKDIKLFKETISTGLRECCPSAYPANKDQLRSALASSLSKVTSCILYFTGYGGCDDKGHVYIILDDVSPPVYIKDIVSWFPDSIKDCQLFFELCLPPSSSTNTHQLLLLPSRKNFIIAISGLNKTDNGRVGYKGGKWTTHLTNTYTKMKGNCSMAAIICMATLKFTKDVLNASPMFTSSSSCSSPYPLKVASHEPTSQPSSKSQITSSISVPKSPFTTNSSSTTTKLATKGTSSSATSSEIPHSKPSGTTTTTSLNAIPTKEELKAALSILSDKDVKNWKDKFAKRLLKNLKVRKQTMDVLGTTSRVDFFINLLYNEKYVDEPPSWEQVIVALKGPMEVKVKGKFGEELLASEIVEKHIGLK